MGPLRKPTEQVSWEQVAAAVPDEAAAFEAVLAEADIDLEDFCIRWEDDCPEQVHVAWERLSQRFDSATGLELEPYKEGASEQEDYGVGFLVSGAWQLSPAGKRFFGKEEDET